MAKPIEFDDFDSAREVVLHLLGAYQAYLSEVDPLGEDARLTAMFMGSHHDPYFRDIGDIALVGYLTQIYNELRDQEQEVWERTVGSAAKELGFDTPYGSTDIPMIITGRTGYHVDLQYPGKGIFKRVESRRPNLLGRILGPSAGEFGYTIKKRDTTLLKIV